MVSNCKDKGERNPTVSNTFSEPNSLGSIGQFSEEHVEHGKDLSGDAHDEEPCTGLEFFFTTACCGDEDVDEYGHEDEPYRQCLKTVEHGRHSTCFGVDIKEAEDERQQIAQEDEGGKNQRHEGSICFTGQTTVAVS